MLICLDLHYTELTDWLKQLTPLSQPVRSYIPETMLFRSDSFSRAFDDVITSKFDWLTGFSLSFVIGRMIALVLAFLHTIINHSI